MSCFVTHDELYLFYVKTYKGPEEFCCRLASHFATRLHPMAFFLSVSLVINVNSVLYQDPVAP